MISLWHNIPKTSRKPKHAPTSLSCFSGPPQKVGERVTRVTPVAKGPVEALLSSLNLGPQQGLDPEPDNIVAVGTFTSTPPGQPPQQVRGPYCILP